MAPFNDATTEKLKAKHLPAAEREHDIITESDDASECMPLLMTVEIVKSAIQKFPNGSSGGPDGFRPQHLKDLTSSWLGEHSSRLHDALSRFSQLVVSGNIPQNICAIFFGASLCALAKSDGGVRPIAVGFTLRRMIGKICNLSVIDRMGDFLRPRQLGFGTQLGAEAAVHAARDYISGLTSEEVVLKIDFKNAFNSVRRDVVMKCVKESIPEIFHFVYQCYSSASSLLYMYEIIESAEGVQQGDPLGPLLFCLAIHDLVKDGVSDLNIWYLDDGTMGGKVSGVLSDFVRILEKGNSLGLVVNPHKCELVVSDIVKCKDSIASFLSIAPDIKVLEAKDGTLLGAPIGVDSIKPAMLKKLEELDRLNSRLMDLDAHDALYLLRHCFAIPKLLYLLRTTPCFHHPDILDRYDSTLRHSLENILNCRLNDSSWTQASLPVAMGGLGVRSAAQLSLPAFLASACSTRTLCFALLPYHDEDYSSPVFNEAYAKWKALVNFDSSDIPNKQRLWDKPILQNIHQRMIDSFKTVADKARFLAVSCKYSSVWLNALPVTSLGLRLTNSQLRIACALRLGIQVCHPHICVCGEEVYPSGVHGLRCKRSAGRSARHYEANDLIRRALISGGVPAILEPPGVSRTDGKRPDGLTMIPWRAGKCDVWDFTCRDTLYPTYVESSASGSGKTATAAEHRKLAKYSNLSPTYEVIPICIETFGAWGPSAISFVREVGRRVEAATGDPRSTSFLMQRLSMAVQRGNAASVLATLPSARDLFEIFEFC